MHADEREILARRARELARPLAGEERRDERPVVRFTLGGERIAIEARWLLGVARLATLAPLPGAEPPLRGVTVWQGELLTVLDLRTLLGISTVGLSDLTRVLVVGDRRPRLGLLVDAVGESGVLASDALHPAPDGSPGRDLLLGVTADAERVLDGARLLQLFD